MMQSIARHIDPPMIAAQIRMERQTHRGSFLLVEGSTDAKRIDKFVDKVECSIVNCYGKSNVVETIELMQDIGLEDSLGLVDADFDRLNPSFTTDEGVVVSRFHDFDLDNALTGVIDRYLMEVAEEAKLAAQGGPRPCVERLMHSIKALSILRYANELRRLRYNLKRLSLEDFFDGETLDIDRMIDVVSVGAFGSREHKGDLRRHINDLMELDLDVLQLTNGHDFLAALGIALREQIGSRRIPQTWRSEVEMHLRFGLTAEDFATTAAYTEICEWERATGLSVLKH
jgi:hypothetical protein